MVDRSSVDNAFAIEGAKLASLFCTATAAASSAPLLVPIAGLGCAAYAATVALDTLLTGHLCPFPLTRMSVGEILLLCAGKGRQQRNLTWDQEYASREGLDEPVPVFKLEPTTIDVPVVSPARTDRLALQQAVAPQVIAAASASEYSDPFELDFAGTPLRRPIIEPELRQQPMTQPQANQRLAPPPLAPQSWVDESSALPTDRASLLAALQRDCPEFVRLLKAPPIRCVGQQRTGKTTLVKLLCLCRQIILKGHQVIAATPHYKEGEGYPSCFKIAGIRGTARDPVAIAREWSAMAQRVNNCGTPGRSYTNIWDEFGLYDSCVQAEDLLSVATSTIRETTKFGEYPIFIVHGETAAFLPGVKGLIGPFLQGTTRVETIGAPAYDDEGIPTVKPTGRFRITWTDGGNSSGQIPEWLTEDLLTSLVSPVTPATVALTPIPARDPWASPDPAIATPSVTPPALPLARTHVGITENVSPV